MKTSLAALLALLLAPVTALAAADCDTIVVTGHPAYPPVTWATPGGLAGAAPDLVSAAGRAAGLKVTFRDMGSWEKAQEAAAAGKADLIVGIYRNDARTKVLEFLEPPFMLDPNAVVVRKGAAFPFAKWADLKGRKGVTNAGESFGTDFDGFAAQELSLGRAPGVPRAFEDLVGGKVDYLIIGLYPGRIEARRLGLESKVEFLPQQLSSAEMFVAFSRKSSCSPAARARFAAALKGAVERGEVPPLLERAEAAFRKGSGG